MDSLKDNFVYITQQIATNSVIVALYMILVIVFIGMIWWKQIQGFANFFQSAPIAYQGSPSVVGLGTSSKYQIEDSSTNRGTGNVFADSVRVTENLVGSYEAPVFNSVTDTLDQYQYNRGKKMTPLKAEEESFKNPRKGSLFMESFTSNTEAKLGSLLHSGN